MKGQVLIDCLIDCDSLMRLERKHVSRANSNGLNSA